MRHSRVLVLVGFAALSITSLQSQSFNRQSYPVSYGSRIERPDINVDGKPDLFSAGLQQGGAPLGFSVLLNQGSGTFSSAISTAVSNLANAQLGDFNNDGKPDVAACIQPATGTKTVSTWLGDGAGHFAKSGTVDVTACSSLAVADFNKDGRSDVATVVANFSGSTFLSNTVTVFLGNGSGGFSGSIPSTGLGTLPIVQLAGGDLDRDGWPDLGVNVCCFDFAFGRVAVLTNDGTAHFSYRQVATGGHRADYLRLRDVNQDGYLDMLFKTNDSTFSIRIFVVLRQPGGSYSMRELYEVGFGDGDTGNLFGIDSADFDGDGIKDIAFGEFFDLPMDDDPPDFWAHFFYAADHSFTTFKSTPKVTVNATPLDVVSGDFDRDGRPDLAVIKRGLPAEGFPRSVEVFLDRSSSAPTCSAVNAGLRTVTFCRPAQGATLRTPTRILANITNVRPLTLVKMYVDGVSRFTGYDNLINRYLTLSPGSHKVTVKASDALGSFSESHTFSVSGTTCTAPATNRTIKICAPTNGNNVWSPFRVLAAVNDSASVTIKIYVDGVSKFQTTSKTIDWTTSLGTGSHRLTVKAWDASGSFSSISNFIVN